MQTIPQKYKRGLTATITAAVLALPIYIGSGLLDDSAVAYADVRPSAHLAQREMKKDKNYEPSSLYNRAHRIIYGDEPVVETRPRIALIINGDEHILSIEGAKGRLYKHLREKFPKDYFALMKATDVNTRLMQYAEEVYYDQRETATVSGKSRRQTGREDVSKSSKVDVDGMPVGMRPRGLADMRCEDFVRAGREFNYDYVLMFTISNGEEDYAGWHFGPFGTNTSRQNIWLRVRFVDVAGGKYIYRNDILAQGKTHSGWRNRRIYRKAIDAAITEALDDIEVDMGSRR